MLSMTKLPEEVSIKVSTLVNVLAWVRTCKLVPLPPDATSELDEIINELELVGINTSIL